MNIENCISSRKRLFVIIPLSILSFVFTSSNAQTNAIKDLKQDAQNLKDKSYSTKPTDPWTIKHVITTEELSSELKDSKEKKPILIHVGFEFLYKQAHIPGSIYAGPPTKQEGLDKIKNAVKEVKKNENIVIYCGCCPWNDCPNIRQAYKIFKELGFTKVKVLYIPNTFPKDWKSKGYAVEGKN